MELFRLTLALIALCIPSIARAEDWPRWRGPQGDGISRETGLMLDNWPEQFKPVWTAEVGLGFVAPIAHQGRIYLFAVADNKRETLTCFNADTGEVIWNESYDGTWGGYYPGTRASPYIENDRIYTYGVTGDLVARELSSGKQLWRLNIIEETGAVPGRYAQASNPVIDGERIIVQGGWGKAIGRTDTHATTQDQVTTTRPTTQPTTRPARGAATTQETAPIHRAIGRGSPLSATTLPATLGARRRAPIAVAVNKNTGKVVWHSEFKGSGSYAAPVLFECDGVRQLVVFSTEGVTSMTPDTGKTLWQAEWAGSSYGNAADPLYRDGHLLISSANLQGGMMLQLTPQGPRRLWESKTIICRFQTGILDSEYLYVNSDGTLKCLKWPSGELSWATAKDQTSLLGFGGSILRVGGDKMILLSQSGRLSLAKATPERFELIKSIPEFVEGRQVWSPPTIHNGKLYAKGDKELVCIDLRAK